MKKYIFIIILILLFISCDISDDDKIYSLFEISPYLLERLSILDFDKNIKVNKLKFEYATEFKTSFALRTFIGKSQLFIEVFPDHSYYQIFEILNNNNYPLLSNYIKKYFKNINNVELNNDMFLNGIDDMTWTNKEIIKININEKVIYYINNYYDESCGLFFNSIIIPIQGDE